MIKTLDFALSIENKYFNILLKVLTNTSPSGQLSLKIFEEDQIKDILTRK